MRSKPARFFQDPTLKIFFKKRREYASPARWDRFFFDAHLYVLELFPNAISK